MSLMFIVACLLTYAVLRSPPLLNAVESAVAERVWVHRTICATNTAAVAMPASPRTTSLHLRRVFVSGAFRPESGMKSLSFE